MLKLIESLGVGSVIIFIVAFITLVVVILVPVFWRLLDVRYTLPVFAKEFDVSGKRKPQLVDCLDEWIIDGGMQEVEDYLDSLQEWYVDCVEEARATGRRVEKKLQKIDEEFNRPLYFHFSMYRYTTKYRTVNYVRHPYRQRITYDSFTCEYDWLVERDKKLEDIDYMCVLSKYSAVNQRGNMTKELRTLVKQRDNYTCQICGKYMPDEVGLHVDHIVPVSKGGKSTLDNLQVLCSVCNLRKSDKVGG